MNKKFNRELAKGGWKDLQKLFDNVKEDGTKISLLLKNGDVVDAIWHYSKDFIEVEGYTLNDVALWSSRRKKEKEGWLKRLLRLPQGLMFMGLFHMTQLNGESL